MSTNTLRYFDNNIHNIIQLIMRLGIIIFIGHFLIFIYVLWSINNDDFLMDKISIQTWTVASLLFFFILALLVSIFTLKKDKQIIFVANRTKIDNIPDFTKLLDYYSILLPFFIFCFSLLLYTFSIFNIIFFLIGMFLSCLSIIVWYLMYLIKSYFTNNINYTFNRANNMYNDYIIKNCKNPFILDDFNKFFKLSINILDDKLEKGIKLDDLKKDDDVSLKKSIIQYLPIYIKYGNQSQIDSLQNHFFEIFCFIRKNNIMKISNIILKIYLEMTQFLESNNYSITKQSWNMKIPSWTKQVGAFIVLIGTTLIVLTLISIIYIPNFITELITSTPPSTLLQVIATIIIAIIGLLTTSILTIGTLIMAFKNN